MPQIAENTHGWRVGVVTFLAALLLVPGGLALAGEGGAHADHEHEDHALGVLHPALVHFPLALSMVAALATFLGALRPGALFQSSETYSCVLAALSSVPAFLIGQEAEAAMGRMSASREAVVSTHETWGAIAMWALLGAAGVHLLARWRSDSTGLRWLSRGLIVATAGVLAFTGYRGGEVARGPGHLDALLPW
jgi:uncharacterized membrane protein